MSNYVSGEIAKDIECINVSEKIAAATDLYNHRILATVGAADSLEAVTTFDREAAAVECQKVFSEIYTVLPLPVIDSLRSSFDNFIIASEGLETVVRSTFVDSREWFFNDLQPAFNLFENRLEEYNQQVHEDLMNKADDFQMGFYRSLVPGIVSVLAGLLLISLLLFFLMVNYVNPIYKMLDGLNQTIYQGKRYSYNFHGDDQLQQLNEQITEVVEENAELKKRVKALRENK